MIRTRMISALAIGLATLFVGCSSDPADNTARTPVDQLLFGPTAMRLHPVFTQVRDWTGDGKPDGIEAVVEMQDQFGDPTKASGRIIFELHGYRPYNPDPRTPRIVAPWEGRLDSLEDQRARWNRVNRAYIFQLAYDDIKFKGDYVLTATFELSGGGRFFDQLILEGKDRPATPSVPPTITTPGRQGAIETTPATPPNKPSTGSTTKATTQEPTSVPTTAHTPPARADQP